MAAEAGQEEQGQGSYSAERAASVASQPDCSAAPHFTGELSATPCEFWLVWTKTGRPPRCRHNTRESAAEEAQRLAQRFPAKTFIVMRGEEKYRVPGPEREDEPHRHPVRALIDELTGALKDARTAICFKSPPVDFGTPDDPNPCYEARVPVAFVEQIDAALARADGR